MGVAEKVYLQIQKKVYLLHNSTHYVLLTYSQAAGRQCCTTFAAAQESVEILNFYLVLLLVY